MKVDFHPAALTEVESAQGWYAQRSSMAAAAFVHELALAIERIREAPHRYPAAEGGSHRLMFNRFPFTIYYRTAGETITVIAVAHQKRRPGYWQSR